MKQTIYRGVILLLSLFALSACDQEQPCEQKEEVYPNLEVEMSEATLQPNQSIEIPIKGGSGDYIVSIPQIGIASAKVGKDNITLTGIKEGETTLIITDKASKQRKEIKVSVVANPVLKLSHRELKTSVGNTEIITILNGSSNYEAELSDPGLGTFYFAEQNFVFSAKKIGNGTITIRDKEFGFSKTIDLTIAPTPLLLSMYDLKIPTGDTAKVSITSGSGDYTVTCSKDGLVEIEVNKNTISITAIAVGEGTITVKDNATELSKEIKLVTTLQPFTTELDGLDELKVYLYDGSERDIEIYTGNGQYQIEVEDETIITAEEVEDKIIVVTPQMVGESKLTIKDVVSGESVTTRIVVTKPLNKITFNTDKVVVSANSYTSVRVVKNETGLTDWYITYRTNDESIATASKSWWGNDINIYGRSAGKTALLAVGDDGTIYGILPIEVQ